MRMQQKLKVFKCCL